MIASSSQLNNRIFSFLKLNLSNNFLESFLLHKSAKTMSKSTPWKDSSICSQYERVKLGEADLCYATFIWLVVKVIDLFIPLPYLLYLIIHHFEFTLFWIMNMDSSTAPPSICSVCSLCWANLVDLSARFWLTHFSMSELPVVPT